MPRKKAPEASVEAPETPQEVKASFDVLNLNGVFVRSYSVEIHGESAESLANEFAAKIGGSVN